MMKLKRILALAMAAATVGSFAACGGGNNNDSVSMDEGRTSVLKVEYLKAGYGTEVFDKLAEAFMKKYTDIQVVLYPNENVNGDTETKLSSGKNIRDVYYVSYYSSVRRWAVRDWVEPITDVYGQEAQEGKTVKEVLCDYTEDMCLLNDEYWALPQETSIGGLIYNASMFEENGWKVPTTTKELETLCETIVKANKKSEDGTTIKPFVYCGSGNDGYWNTILNTWWLQYSGAEALETFAKFENPEVFKDEGRLKALELLQKFAFNGKYILPNTQSKDANTAQLDFLMGKAAMIPCGSWFETEMQGWLEYYPDVEFKMMATPVVSDANGNSLAHDKETNCLWDGGTAVWFIPKAAENKDNAKKWINFLASEESCNIWTEYTGATRPFEYDDSSSSEVYQKASAFSKSLLDLKNNTTAYKFITTHPIALASYVGLWPQQRSPFISLYNGGVAASYYAADYEYVNDNWNTWKGLVGIQ